MALPGQALNPGYYWSGTRVCAGPGAPRYIGAIACWEYYRAPLDVFAAASPYQPSPPPPPNGGGSTTVDVPHPVSIPAPPTTTGGTGSPPAPESLPGKSGCGCGGGGVAPVPGPTGSPTPTPVTTPAAGGVVFSAEGLPWWVYVLAALAIAKAIRG